MTSIFVTHDQTEANALADRIAVMEGGVLQQFAAQQELKDRPANLFVATFIGEPPMNVFDADVVNADRVCFAIANGPTLDYAASEVPQGVRNAIGSRARVAVGVRPHSVRLGSGPRTPASSRTSGWATRPISRSMWRENCSSRFRTRRSRRSRESVCAMRSLRKTCICSTRNSGAALSHGLEAA